MLAEYAYLQVPSDSLQENERNPSFIHDQKKLLTDSCRLECDSYDSANV